MGEYKTPGVYIKEKNAFGNSVVEAETAIPAFIGITEKAVNGTDSLVGKPWKITSMTEFYNYFGGAPELSFCVDVKRFNYLTPNQLKEGKVLPASLAEPAGSLFVYADRSCKEEDKEVDLTNKDGDIVKETVPVGYALCVDGQHPYSLYYNMLMFFANGGGSCYIVSVGTYDYDTYDSIDDKKVESALEALKLEREVTMIVVPEAATIEGYANIQQVMMKHCGEMANRFSILDVPQRNENTQLPAHIESFQNTVTNYFSYGAAYYPWLNTTVLSEKDIKESIVCYTNNFVLYHNKFSLADSGFDKIIRCLMTEDKVVDNGDQVEIPTSENKWSNIGYTDIEAKATEFGLIVEKKDEGTDNETKTIKGLPKRLNKEQIDEAHAALFNGSSFYNRIIKGVVHALNQLPPSAAMAGIYTMVDNTRGVWKAPANIGLNYVDSLTETIGDAEQQDLNVPVTGKAINVIRSFRGEGNKVWGARTLDGNSQDWRYINVRRTMMFLEESVRNAARAYVFEPNDASTWINMKCMIENFLRSVWKRGGLAGATPEEASEVHVGLGDTMTADDILEGIMRITVLVAITRPAEFIEITFQQQMQKS